MSLTNCRFYEEKYPEIDSFVMVNVKQIAEMGAYVKLLEYDNIDGMILLSELSRRRIRSIQKLIRVGRNEVVVVLRVDKDKGYIDLSKRRVSPEDITKCDERYNKSKMVHSILRHVAEKTKTPIEDLYQSIGWPLNKKYGHAVDAFKLAITNTEVWNEVTFPNKVIEEELKSYISKRLTPQPTKVRADVEVTCFNYEGIDAVKEALRAAEAQNRPDAEVKVKLVSPPHYVLTSQCLDKNVGIELLNQAIKEIEKKITASKGKCLTTMAPKAVTANDDAELQALMDKRAKENEEVSGDESQSASDDGAIEALQVLPTHGNEGVHSAIAPEEVTKVALRLKYLIEQVVPCELEEWKITKANSPIITKRVEKLAMAAGGDEHSACVVYGLLVCKRWFKRQSALELWDADLLNVRAVACEVLAKHLIEIEDDQEFLLQHVLLKRFSILQGGEPSHPANVIERAVDLHSLRVIGSSGYQKCISYLWRGWLVQDEDDPSQFVDWKDKGNKSYWAHLDPDRMRSPMYQNAVQVFFSLLYLVLYTQAVNSINPTGDIDVVEGFVYLFTFGFICDEISKLWKVGRYYIGFWNMFNSVLYALLSVSFIMRLIALSHPIKDEHDGARRQYNNLSYNFFAFSAPMFWMRLLLYLDTFRFFGAMLVVLKVMMKESLIFFALLIAVIVGFLQAFIGMDHIDDNRTVTSFILQAMAQAILQSPNFDGFENFAPPFGITLYYIFTFVVMVILLNILIALYNSAYEDITDNAVDEYMALFATKTMQFVRAPDENVFIAPLNLIELFLLILPFEWWMPKDRYERLNDYVMATIYSPLLLITAFIETREAGRISHNRHHKRDDDDTVEEWEDSGAQVDFEGDGWAKKVEQSKPNVEIDAALIEIREVKSMLKEMLSEMERLRSGANGDSST
ncbi:MAG: hypothetical protein M1814_003031 [Vezdaea aestivalis]|nr:MAG: hypothetical protein M1814_003031 [Vezdaea aestivalis]